MVNLSDSPVSGSPVILAGSSTAIINGVEGPVSTNPRRLISVHRLTPAGPDSQYMGPQRRSLGSHSPWR